MNIHLRSDAADYSASSRIGSSNHWDRNCRPLGIVPGLVRPGPWKAPNTGPRNQLACWLSPSWVPPPPQTKKDIISDTIIIKKRSSYLFHSYGSSCSISQRIKDSKLELWIGLFSLSLVEDVVDVFVDFFEIFPQVILVGELFAQQPIQLQISACRI